MIHTITIRPVLNGYLVQVGCQSLVFDDTRQMLDQLLRYLVSPNLVEDEYRQTAINKWMFSTPLTMEERLPVPPPPTRDAIRPPQAQNQPGNSPTPRG
jgi:hypothetical protein